MAQVNKKKILFIFLKVFVSGSALFFVFQKAGTQEVFYQLTSIDPLFFLFSALLYFVALYISSIRWKMLLEENYSIRKLFSLYLIGSFFNNLLPGVIGGDTVKIYYLYRDTKKGGSSLGSVFMDRYIGYAALLFIGLLSTLLAFGRLRDMGIQWFIPLLFIVFIAGSFLIFGIRLGKRFSAIASFYDYFHTYIKKRQVMVSTFILSVIIQIIGIFMVYIIALGLDQRPSLVALFVFLPIIITIMSIPISISGFGVREGAFVVLFGMIGISPQVATSISFLWFLSLAFVSLIGLVEYMRYKGKKPH